ncbi:hypothetical protein BDF20DRAFT_884788 [Mycotypha africana]|uniref:uncharacterized protein n=1 Tax=Mycotypha africana TaxID=64632 RepID=UPI002300CD97|nr:uncharacterized protein BDF20DRAFT_884788 [Mycotypha africana]KAI8971494.1 hypothetical protein BDF20DRAFT_884788 [Mycotypha africana]
MANTGKQTAIPTVAVNNAPITSKIPLATEEPVRRSWLKSELAELNSKEEEEAVLERRRQEGEEEDSDLEEESNGSSSDVESIDSRTGQNKIKNIEAAKDDDSVVSDIEESPKTTPTKDKIQDKQKPAKDEFEARDIMACLQQEMREYQERQDSEVEKYEQSVTNEEDLLNEDPDLLRRTESNRHIPYDEPESKEIVCGNTSDSSCIHVQSNQYQKSLLVFSDNPTVIEEPTKLRVVQYYGAGRTGVMPSAYRQTRPSKAYLVACDFSKESLYALEWTMGTMMRDGDELHVATVANRDDNPDIVDASGLDQKEQLRATSDALIAETKKLMGQMMLFNIKLITYVMIGRIKDALKALMREHNYTMIVCGSRGRGSMKTWLMGSVSTYLVHKSPVPVAVIRRQKKKKMKHEKLVAHSLSESMKTGQLHVDELS